MIYEKVNVKTLLGKKEFFYKAVLMVSNRMFYRCFKIQTSIKRTEVNKFRNNLEIKT